MTTEEIINNGYIWKNELGIWCRKCPKCKKILESKINKYINSRGYISDGKYYAASCVSKNTLCCKCSKSLKQKNRELQLGKHSGNKNSMFGKHHLQRTIDKISKSKVGKIVGNENSFYGKHHSNRIKKILSKKWKLKYKSGYINPFKGKVLSEETKLKMRVSKLKRFEKLGIRACEDKGAKEWFDKYNKETGLNFKPKVFMEIGYVADGYDKDKHIWMEYDTPYHSRPVQRRKDLIRQNNIIKYFKNINNPLNGFIRVKYNKIITNIC